MLNGTALTKGQCHKLKNWFIDPYISMLVDTLENAAPQVLATLIQLVTSPVSEKQKKLVIAETVTEKDDELKKQIQKILPLANKNLINEIYNILYKMLHEMRLNKNPDSPFADDHNAIMIEQGNAENLYDQTYHKTQTLAFRLGTDGPIPSDLEVEAGFLAVVKEVMLDKMKEMAPVLPVQDKNDIDVSEEDELQLAIELSKQQPSFFIQFDDEFLARKLQVEEEELYAKMKLQEEEDYRYARKLLISSQ
ncbi:MAG: hypothetical protein HYX61_04755 [Gammaproteobacteria bacterium]|jgi:hypothetical protein|nr:hypothetical protein [Gammaproteobacteria bacterium]